MPMMLEKATLLAIAHFSAVIRVLPYGWIRSDDVTYYANANGFVECCSKLYR